MAFGRRRKKKNKTKLYSYLFIFVEENPQLQAGALEIMCLSQLEILEKRNLRNFSYSTWHQACLATSFWVICLLKQKSEVAWHSYRSGFLHPRAAPYLQGNTIFPSCHSRQAGQCAAERALPRIIVFPGKTAWPRDTLLSFSLQIYLPPQKVAILVQIQEVWPATQTENVSQLEAFHLAAPPTATTRDWKGIECSQRWGRSLAWCQWPFSPEKFRNSPALICWCRVAEEEEVVRERQGKASQTLDGWPGDREESGQWGREEICLKPGRNNAQHHLLPAWQASHHGGAGDSTLRNYFPQQIYLQAI